MKPRFFPIVFLFGWLAACQPDATHTTAPATEPDTLRLSLDWSPNVLHAGIFYALQQGWYADSGLVVDYFTPEIDGYVKKPILRLLNGEADLSIGPSEHQLHYGLEKGGEVTVKAVASLLQQGTSCFVTRPEIARPAALDGTIYLGYQTPQEQAILAAMIQHDGGAGQFSLVTPGRLDVWEAFMQEKGATCWVFRHWEAVMADTAGLDLNHFYPQDYGVPYGYSSLLYARAELDAANEAKIRRFLAVSEQGYRYVAQHPKAVAGALCQFIDHPNFSDPAFIRQALQQIAPAFLSAEGQWGQISPDRYQAWVDWLDARELIHSHDSTVHQGNQIEVEALIWP